jgi:hypothetical protein
MRALIIRAEEQAAIKAAIERARARPLRVADVVRLAVPDTDTVTLADRRPEHDRPPSQHVALPGGFHLAISFEEQPAGMCLHLSVSIERKNKAPNPYAVGMLVQECLLACGREPPQDMLAALTPDQGRSWVEEFLVDGKPGGLAVNVLYVIDPAVAGHA